MLDAKISFCIGPPSLFWYCEWWLLSLFCVMQFLDGWVIFAEYARPRPPPSPQNNGAPPYGRWWLPYSTDQACHLQTNFVWEQLLSIIVPYNYSFYELQLSIDSSHVRLFGQPFPGTSFCGVDLPYMRTEHRLNWKVYGFQIGACWNNNVELFLFSIHLHFRNSVYNNMPEG